MDQILCEMQPYLADIDEILRAGHTKYLSTPTDLLIDHDARAQANCTYCYMVKEAERRFLEVPDIRQLEIRGLKLWHFEKANTVLRWKKMNESGNKANYPTEQSQNYDCGEELPGLPMPPVRLIAGYLLDEARHEYIRSQIMRPAGSKVMWCGAIIPDELVESGQPNWEDVTAEPMMKF